MLSPAQTYVVDKMTSCELVVIVFRTPRREHPQFQDFRHLVDRDLACMYVFTTGEVRPRLRSCSHSGQAVSCHTAGDGM